MQLNRGHQVAAQGGTGGPGEKAGGTGDARERPHRAGPPRQGGVAGLQPETTGEGRREQPSGAAETAEQTPQARTSGLALVGVKPSRCTTMSSIPKPPMLLLTTRNDPP